LQHTFKLVRIDYVKPVMFIGLLILYDLYIGNYLNILINNFREQVDFELSYFHL